MPTLFLPFILLASFLASHGTAATGVSREPLRRRLSGDEASGGKATFGIVTGYFDFVGVKVFYQMLPVDPANRWSARTGANKTTVLLLHGKRYTSDDWVTIGTLSALRDAGFEPIAVDLPGYGRTAQLPYLDHNLRAELVHMAFEHVNAMDRVMVVPSMAGYYALPYIELYGNRLLAMVAVAPAGVKAWEGPGIPGRTINLLAVYGSNDVRKQELEHLRDMFAHASTHVMPDTGHACYMDNPKAFNRLLTSHCQTAVQLKNKTMVMSLY